MKKFSGALIFAALAAFVFVISGCGGSSSKPFSNNTDTSTVKQIASLTTPAFTTGKNYRIYKNATLEGMKGAQYFIANSGSESTAATMNLGFLDEPGESDTLVFVDDDTGKVVFAYDPSGTDDTALTDGTVSYSGGTRLSYNSLNIASSFFTAMNVDTSDAKEIILNGNSATYEGLDVTKYPYVWHADPDHEDEYYTDGIDGIVEYTEDDVLSKVSADEVYIAYDVRYMPRGLDFTATVTDDDETEYAAYYSSSVQSAVAAKLGTGFEGPFIFATLPNSTGTPGGTPGTGSGDFTPGGTPPARPGSVISSATSYNSQIASTIEAMTHTSADAYANPVLHITKAGTYSLKGTWNGQIWIDVGKNEAGKVAIILNGVTVKCTVAPAIVFHDLYECGPDDETSVAAESMDVGKNLLDNAGAMVVIADDTTNNFTGSNVYRMLKAARKKDSVTKIDGTDVSQQEKRYKMDGAFYSFVSLAIGGGTKSNGILNITSSTYEGLNTEMHLTIESGTINISTPDDAINVNEDAVSVFTMLDGNMTISSTNGDGIDSNGYIILLGGSLDITAGNQDTAAAGEGGIDYDSGYYKASSVNYTHHSASGGNGGGTPPDGTPPDSDDITPPDSEDITPPDSDDDTQSEDESNIPVTEISDEPVGTYTDYEAPSDADKASMMIKTSNGTTTFNMGTGSTAGFVVKDEDQSARNIPSSGNVFPLVRKVNTFSRIK